MKRFLIRDGATREASERVFQDLGWHGIDSPNTMPELIRYKSSWVDADGSEAANYLENVPFDAAYVMASDGSFDLLMSAFADRGLLLGKDELLEYTWTDDNDALRTIGRLGLLAHGEFDARLFSKLAALLLQPNPMWQRFALFSLSNTAWPELGDVVRRGIEEDLYEEDLAAAATALLEDLEKSQWNESLYRG